jgi:uncharacterized membrane protein YfcA
MLLNTHDLLAGVIIFAAHCVSAVTGFGANILGLPLLALVVGLVPGKQALIVQGVLLSIYMSTRWRHRVDVKQLVVILIVAGAGLVVGMLVFELLPPRGSAIALSIFVIAVGLRGLLNVAPAFRAPPWLARVMLFLGGAVHGAFTTGGPLLVIYCRRALPHKSVFRATLAVMWLALAIGLCIGWTISHAWDAATPRVILVGLPFLIAGIVVGEYLHHRVDEARFGGLVNVTLIAVGTVLLLSSLFPK